MSELQRRSTEYLQRLLNERIFSFPEEGQERFIRPDVLNSLKSSVCAGGGVALAAAYVADRSDPSHPLADHPLLWKLAEELGDGLAERTHEAIRDDLHSYHFHFRWMPHLLGLMDHRLAKARRKRWTKAIHAYIAFAGEFLERKKDVLGLPGPYAGTGPNHIHATASRMYSAARSVQDATSARIAKRALRKMLTLQTPEGYFPEHTGPSTGYQYVYLSAMVDVLGWREDKAFREAMERILGFLLRAMYPNRAPLETIDQRNRYQGPLWLAMSATCAWTPQGRAVALDAVNQAMNQVGIVSLSPRRSSQEIGSVALMCLQCPPGQIGRVPAQRKAYRENFEDLAVVTRRDGWFVCLSGYHEHPQLHNPFQLERTQNLSIYHDTCGLIVGGGNDKFSPTSATVELLESEEVYVFPAIEARAAARSTAKATLEMFYGPARAQLETKIVSDTSLELTTRVETNFFKQHNRLNLQLHLKPHDHVVLDGQTVRLPAHETPTEVIPVKQSIALPGKWTITFDEPGLFQWPHLPYNTYGGRPNQSTIEMAVGYLRLPLDGQDTPRTVRFTVDS